MCDGNPGNESYVISAREILGKIISQDHFWWDYDENERRKKCSLLRHGNLITVIHEHFRKLEPEYCSTLNTHSRRSPGCSSASHGDPQQAMIEKERRGYSCIGNTNDVMLYRSATLCCDFPVLAAKTDLGRMSYLDEANPLQFQHYSLETSKRLLEYLRRIFDQSMTNHQRYQISINKGEQYNDKKEILKNLLRSQLSLVETDSNPYYSKENFQSYFDYKSWQDSERDKISLLLGGNISRHRGRYKQEEPSKRDRGADYKKLLKKVMTYDLQNVRSVKVSVSSSADNNSVSDGSSSELYGGYEQLISNKGQRLLKEFAARYRVTSTTQLCMYLEVTETCIDEGLLNFKTPMAMRNLQRMITNLQDLFKERMPMLTSEVNMVIHVCGSLLDRIKQLVITLLTEWRPTTKELSCGLELAKSCYEILHLLNYNEHSEWPHCLFGWFEAATIDDYHSYKKPDFIATPSSVLSSVSHAVEVVRSMRNSDSDGVRTNYQSVFSEYIPNFPQAVCRGLYEAVMTDVKLLRNKFPWQRTKPLERNRYDGTEMKKHQEVLNLANIAIAYKLAEFDKFLHCDEFPVSVYEQPEESWRLYFHQFAMHWLDVLSCHMRQLVLRAIRLDDFKIPKKRDDAGKSTEPECPRFSRKTTPEEDDSFSDDNLEENPFTQHLVPVEVENQTHAEYDIFERHPGRSQNTEERHQGTAMQSRQGGRNLVNNMEEEGSDTYTLEVEASAAASSLTMSPENSCKLVSYKKISDSPDNSSVSGSYYSCERDASVTEDRNNWATSDSADYGSFSETANFSSDRKFSSALTESSSDVGSDCSSSRTSSCNSIVPIATHVQSLHLSEGTALRDVTRGSYDPEAEASLQISETVDEKSSFSKMEDDSMLEDDIVFNVSSSVVDVISMISRFLQFACRTVNTVYGLPMKKECDIFFAKTPNSYLLGQLKDNFIQKVVQSVCEVIRQYSNNIVNIDQTIVPREMARELIGRRKLAEILNGRYNKTVISGSMYLHQPFISEVRPDDSLFHKMINRLNSLLALENGLPDLWLHIEQAMSSRKSLISSSNEPSSLFSYHTSPEPRDPLTLTSPGVLSSDDTPCTSSSVRTAIYRTPEKSNNPRQDDKNNNNDVTMDTGKVLDAKEPSLSTNGDIAMDQRSNKHRCDEDAVKNASTSFLSPSVKQLYSEDEELRQEFAEPKWNFLQEYLESHISTMVHGMTGFLAYKSGHWFGIMLNFTLKDASVVIDERTNANYTPGNELISRLNILLDTLSSLVHKEGINAVHEMLWLKILQHFRDASSTLRTVDAQLHASHTLSVFTIVLKIWQHHQSRPNNSDHDWLVKPIQPTLNILELYSHFTEILLEMYQRCEEELVLNFDLMSATASQSQITNCREVILQAMHILQDRKSFSGDMLHRTLRTIICDQNPSVANGGCEDADQLCQHMLKQDMLLFVFKQKRKKTDQMPDVISVSLEHFAREGRSFSVSTGDSQQSFPSSEDQSFVTQSYSSDYHNTFYNEENAFYRFSPTLLPMNVTLDDLIKLLRVRSRTDKSAKRFLQQHGHLPRSPLSMCLGGCWS